jgi:hypothetical protein
MKIKMIDTDSQFELFLVLESLSVLGISNQNKPLPYHSMLA